MRGNISLVLQVAGEKKTLSLFSSQGPQSPPKRVNVKSSEIMIHFQHALLLIVTYPASFPLDLFGD